MNMDLRDEWIENSQVEKDLWILVEKKFGHELVMHACSCKKTIVS